MQTLSTRITENLQPTAPHKQEIRIVYFEGSNQFDSEKVLVTLEDAKTIAKDKIFAQFKYRNTPDTIWCEFYLAGKKLDEFEDRIKFKNGIFIK